MIQTGQLKPGDKLDSVQQLAENFQVGRAAIREALTALRAMGLIEMKQGEGTYVREFDPAMLSFPISAAVLMNKEDVAHLLEVRKLLEVGAAGVAAKRRTDEDLRAMQSALTQMREAIGDEELGEKRTFYFIWQLPQQRKSAISEFNEQRLRHDDGDDARDAPHLAVCQTSDDRTAA